VDRGEEVEIVKRKCLGEGRVGASSSKRIVVRKLMLVKDNLLVIRMDVAI
jgi:hypothetical protein